MLAADAAMKSIMRRAVAEGWKIYPRGLAAESVIENATPDELRRFDKTRQH
jgi:hypothetical protein